MSELDKEFEQAAERFHAAVLDMLNNDYPAALSIVTGTFVSLTLEIMRRNGHDTDQKILIDGGNNRDITIHALKSAEPSGGEG